VKLSIIGGAGRVGLPLGLSFARAGLSVTIIDKDIERVELINQRKMPFIEKGAEEIISSLTQEQLTATSNFSGITGSDVCILIIGTAVDNNGIPESKSISNFVCSISKYLTSTKLLILRSTLYPGITDEVEKALKSEGLNILVAYCPERITEGNALQEIKTLPQIIGVNSDEAYELSLKVFNFINSNSIRTSFKEAELSKLFANTYRYLNFAISNEFFKICSNAGVDWQNVWHAIKKDYPRAASLAVPGFASGPCLKKDTAQLFYYSENSFQIGKVATDINEGLPMFIVNRMQKLFNLSNLSIGILGMTFKSEVDDFRSSHSFQLKEILEKISKKVYCSDEVLQEDYFVAPEVLIDKSDIVIISTPHLTYAKLNIEKPIIDIWRINKSPSLI
jgi:UDP-N-acetyl-D-mannosaminuronic acid dehydrogenase